jgi:hypothetical protein
MKKPIVVLTIVAAAAMTFTAGAEAHHRKVLCGNFGGQGPDPRLARKPASCNVTRIGRGPAGPVVKLRSMRWNHWRGRAKGRGLVDGRQRTVRLRRGRPCGQHGEFSVYSRMKLGDQRWRPILHCGD